MAAKRKSVAPNAPIDLNRLTLFVAVAEGASFSEAAQKLDLRRSSVSRGVAALEASLGVQLFSRTTRKVALTTAGSALYAKLAPQLEALRGSLSSLPEREEAPSGTLRISAPNDLGTCVLAEVVTAFSARYPHVQVEVLLSNQMVDLVGEQFDLALRVARGARLSDSSLVGRKVGQLELKLYAAPNYLARMGTPRTPEELAGHDFVTFRRMVFRPPLLPPRRPPRVLGDDILFVRAALRSGAGVGGLPGFVAFDDVARGALVAVLPRLSLGTSSLFLVHPASQRVPRKVSAFIQFFVEQLARQPLS